MTLNSSLQLFNKENNIWKTKNKYACITRDYNANTLLNTKLGIHTNAFSNIVLQNLVINHLELEKIY